jgi:hypothetical protein
VINNFFDKLEVKLKEKSKSSKFWNLKFTKSKRIVTTRMMCTALLTRLYCMDEISIDCIHETLSYRIISYHIMVKDMFYT